MPSGASLLLTGMMPVCLSCAVRADGFLTIDLLPLEQKIEHFLDHGGIKSSWQLCGVWLGFSASQFSRERRHQELH